MEKEDKIRSITLRLAIFFGLTTFTLCIAIFYIQSIIASSKNIVNQKDTIINTLEENTDVQLKQIQANEKEIRMLKDELEDMQNEMNSTAE